MKRISEWFGWFGPVWMFVLIFAYVGGCFTPAQRDQAILDLQTAKATVELVYPPGPTRDKWLAELDKATTVEQLIQIRAKAQAASTQPVK